MARVIVPLRQSIVSQASPEQIRAAWRAAMQEYQSIVDVTAHTATESVSMARLALESARKAAKVRTDADGARHKPTPAMLAAVQRCESAVIGAEQRKAQAAALNAKRKTHMVRIARLLSPADAPESVMTTWPVLNASLLLPASGLSQSQATDVLEAAVRSFAANVRRTIALAPLARAIATLRVNAGRDSAIGGLSNVELASALTAIADALTAVRPTSEQSDIVKAVSDAETQIRDRRAESARLAATLADVAADATADDDDSALAELLGTPAVKTRRQRA